MDYSPTPEQTDVIGAVRQRKSLIVQACAGAGKTATIAQFGKALPSAKGYYFAFNTAIVQSAAAKLPSNMKAYTIHGYAMGRKGRFYSHRLNSKYRMTSKQAAEFLAIPEIEMDSHTITAPKAASMVMRAISEFCKSDSWGISGFHLPRINGLSPEEMKYLRNELDPFIKAAWADIENTQGKLNFGHSHYVKLWALDPRVSRIAADFVVIDEAQDVMACVIPVLQRRERDGKQLIVVGDEYQSINEWNGAKNSMRQFPDFLRLMMSRSFRFGQEIADIANLWLESMGAEMTITGTGNSEIGDIEFPDAILCRTNAGTIEAAIRELEQDRSVALLGNTEEFVSVADAAIAIQSGMQSDHELFAAFSTWPQVQAFAKSDDPDADEIKTWVNLIDSYGAQAIKDMTDALVSADNADVVVSTAHKTKGLEFGSVRVGSDFPEPDNAEKPLTDADKMLAYVTVTRAQRQLQPGNLASPGELDTED